MSPETERFVSPEAGRVFKHSVPGLSAVYCQSPVYRQSRLCPSPVYRHSVLILSPVCCQSVPCLSPVPPRPSPVYRHSVPCLSYFLSPVCCQSIPCLSPFPSLSPVPPLSVFCLLPLCPQSRLRPSVPCLLPVCLLSLAGLSPVFSLNEDHSCSCHRPLPVFLQWEKKRSVQ